MMRVEAHTMTTLSWLIVLSVAFAVTHIVLSHRPIRDALIRLMGEWPFRGLYSVISLVTLVGAGVLLWRNRHAGPLLWDLPGWLVLAIAIPLMLVALLLLVTSVANPSPAAMVPGSMAARGALRITRHPMNIGIGLFGLAHVIANGWLGDVAFFGALAVVGLLGPWHQDRRKAVELGEPYRELQKQTSIIPFAAILTGRNRLAFGELKLPLVLIAVILFAALFVFHGTLFGIKLY
jgi:uncharacterized membrane protein